MTDKLIDRRGEPWSVRMRRGIEQIKNSSPKPPEPLPEQNSPPPDLRPGETLKNYFARTLRESRAPTQEEAFDRVAREEGKAKAIEIFGPREELTD